MENIAMTYTLSSMKMQKNVTVDSEDEAIAQAREMQEELQSAYGVTVLDEDGAVVIVID
jgi:hypothetical protein